MQCWSDMSDNEAATGTESSPSQCTGQVMQDPLVAVTFQKNPKRKQKFLEAEPKALGITQIGLCVYQISWWVLAFVSHITDTEICVFYITLNLPVIIAGSLAIAAQNLHLPTLRACLGMQVLACMATVIKAFYSVGAILVGTPNRVCWYWHDYRDLPSDTYFNDTYPDLEPTPRSQDHTICLQVREGYSHLFAGFMLIQAASMAISCTLAAYCCKVVNCCSPGTKMPVITVQASTAQRD